MLEIASVALAVGALLFTLVVRRKDLHQSPAAPAEAFWEEKKATIYENLRDLQFEYRVGKLSDEDYQAAKKSLQRELAGVATAPKSADAPAAPVVAPAAKPAAAPGTLCPRCGATFAHPLKFCGECGAPMKGGAA